MAIKGFKQFHKEKLYDIIQTQFGKHSVPKYDIIQTQFGKHSLNKADAAKLPKHKLKEDFEPVHDGKAHEALSNHYSKYSKHHVSAIKKYTGSSAEVNRALVNHNGSVDKLDKKHQNHVKHLDDAIKQHKTPHDLHVHSGLGFDPRERMKKHGDHYKGHLPAYTSTSIHHSVAKEFSKPHFKDDGIHEHSIHIHVPAGHHGAYVAHHSKHSGEREFILPRNTKVHIHHKPDVTKTKDENGAVTHHYTWHAKIVHDDE